MGNRSYLYNKETQVLFEANNNLPLFWLGLLNMEMLERYQLVWEEHEKAIIKLSESDELAEGTLYDFWQEWTDKLDFIVTQEEFLENSQQLATFSQRNLGKIDGLTIDFIAFLGKELPAKTDYLRVEVLEFADFYESVADFFAFLTERVRMLSQSSQSVANDVLENPLGEGTGFSTYDNGPDFKAFSTNYRLYEGPVPIVETRVKTPQSTKTFIWVVFLLLVLMCLMLLWTFKRSQNTYLSEGEKASVAQSFVSEKITQFDVENERLVFDLPAAFNLISEGDVSDANGNSWLVVGSDDYPELSVELSIKNKASTQSPDSYSLIDHGLNVTKKEKVDYHGFPQEVLMTLSEKGFVYEVETEGIKGDILFFLEESLKPEEQVMFEQMIDSLGMIKVRD